MDTWPDTGPTNMNPKEDKGNSFTFCQSGTLIALLKEKLNSNLEDSVFSCLDPGVTGVRCLL